MSTIDDIISGGSGVAVTGGAGGIPNNFNAEQAENDREIEMQFAVVCFEQAEAYMNLIKKVKPSTLKRLTKYDDEILEAFSKAFPELQDDDRLRKLDETELKSKSGKQRWRDFMTPFEKRIDDYNFGTLIRADCSGDYTEDNSIFGRERLYLAIPFSPLFPRTELERELQIVSMDAETLSQFYRQQIQPVASVLSRPVADSAPSMNLTEDVFIHAYILVSSRAFAVDAWHGLALVPVADAFNHSDLADAHLETDQWVCPHCGSLEECPHDGNGTEPQQSQFDHNEPATDDCLMVTTRDVDGGREVFNSYGQLSNAQLVVQYGFCIDGNDADVITLDPDWLWRQLWPDRQLDQVASERVKACVKASVRGYCPELNRCLESSSFVQYIGPQTALTIFSIDADARLSLSLWIALVMASSEEVGKPPHLDSASHFETDVELVRALTVEAEVHLNNANKPVGPGAGFANVAAIIRMICERRISSQSASNVAAYQILDMATQESDDDVRHSLTLLGQERALLECVVDLWSPE
ncbi:hypothetical protein OIO90_004132 [Microbotryomycetes sp. JL221]|nr:hypothetical protein OIO90_004132 [Microbotryomycetes sp. JL221]